MAVLHARQPAARKNRGVFDQRAILGTLIGAVAVMTLLLMEIGGGKIWADNRPPVTVGAVPETSSTDNQRANAGDPRSSFGKRLGAGLVLVPIKRSATTGYAISAESDSAVLTWAQLRQRDLLTEVDGRPLNQSRVDAIGDELDSLDAVEVSFIRDGLSRHRVVDLTR